MWSSDGSARGRRRRHVRVRRHGRAARALRRAAARVVARRLAARGRARWLARGRRRRRHERRARSSASSSPARSACSPTTSQFTPDGQSIAYDATGAGPRLVPVAGGPSVKLPGAGAWSSDSASYAFVIDRSDGTQIRVGDRTGGGSRLLALLPAGSRVERLLWSGGRPRHPLRHEPPEQRPRAVLDAARRRRPARG